MIASFASREAKLEEEAERKKTVEEDEWLSSWYKSRWHYRVAPRRETTRHPPSTVIFISAGNKQIHRDFFLSFFLFSLYDLSPLYSFFSLSLSLSFSSFMTIVLRQQRTLSIVKDVLFIIIIISKRYFIIQLFHE